MATVTWIYDGDTIEVDHSGAITDIRLMGINAPDSGECLYEVALDYLIETLKGRQVEMTTIEEDQFDRTLAYVWLEGHQVNLDLVSRGLAIATTPDEGDGFGEMLLDAEERARSEGLGLWGPSVCDADGEIPEVVLEVDPHEEVITIQNQGSVPLEIGAWVIRDESSRHRYRFLPTTLDPGASIEIASADPGWDPGEPNVWNNNGDMAMLLDDHGRVVVFLRYP